MDSPRDPFFSTPREAAKWWISQGAHVVPVLPRLFDNGGKKAPKPYGEWKWDDPTKPIPPARLTTGESVDTFWIGHPEAQLAIVLGSGIGCVDVDLAKLGATPPDGFPLPKRMPGGFCETTKSNGEHILFRYKVPLPPTKPTRVTCLGGYVDVLCGGLLFTAPSAFENHKGRYEVACWGDLPAFDTVADALQACAPWLVEGWKKRGAASPPSSASPHSSVGEKIPGVGPRVEHALAAIENDPEISRIFHEGYLKPNGEPDRSQTEFRLAGFLKRRGVAADATYQVIQSCPHTKSPRDHRGQRYFLEQIWGRLESPPIPEDPPRSVSGREFDRTEFGNADRLLSARGGEVHYDVARQKWLAWDGRRWAVDETGVVRRWTEAVLSAIISEADSAESKGDRQGEDRAEALRKWWARSSTDAKIASCLAVASHRPGVPVMPEDLDPDAFLLTVSNGTLDLRTGELQPHRPGDMITRLVPVSYNPSARCPTWEQFVLDAMMGDADRAAFLQRAVGYSLTGSTREQVFFLNWGAGNNGKSTFLDALRSVLGDYSWAASSGTFLRQDTQHVRQDLAVLRGVRLCTTSEIEDGQRLDEDLVKGITGGDPIQARYLFSKTEAQFKPELKLWMAVNHKPQIRGQDEGIWRRVVLIPWEWQITEAMRDRDFAAKLAEEREGILAWAVRGHAAYEAQGLSIPESISRAAREYRAESDFLEDFIRDAFDPATKGAALRDHAAVSVAEAYCALKGWCAANGEKPPSQRWFSIKLKEKGFTQDRNKTTRYWVVSLSDAGHNFVRDGARPVREESFRRGYG